MGDEVFESDPSNNTLVKIIEVNSSSGIKETVTYFFGRYFSTQGSWRDEAIP